MQLQTQQTSINHSLRALTQSSRLAQLPVASVTSSITFTREIVDQLKANVVQSTHDEYSRLAVEHSRRVIEQTRAGQEAILKEALDNLRPTLQLQRMIQQYIIRQPPQGITPDMQL